MRLIEKIKDRYNFLVVVLVILMSALTLRLAILTIAKGDKLRERADNIRLREIEVTAPRGEIRDRNGKLLAGNVPRFTVQLFKDEIKRYDSSNEKGKKNLKKNQAFLTLTRLLEEDGVEYQNEFPIKLNYFEYKNEEDYINDQVQPIDKVVDKLIEHDAINELLSSFYVSDEYEEHYKYIVANRTISIYGKKGTIIPIQFSIEDGVLRYSFTDSEDEKRWKLNNNIPLDYDPVNSLAFLVREDKTVLKSTIDTSLGRKLAYNILVNRGVDENIILEEFAITYEKDYLKQKRNLSRIYEEINMNTSAEEDFATIFQKEGLEEILHEIYDSGKDGKKQLIPGKILLDIMSEKGVNLPIKIKQSKGIKNKKEFKYENTENKSMNQDEIVNYIVDYAIRTNSVKKFVSNKDIRPKAQSILLSKGINPRIAISSDDLEYVAMNELKQFYESHMLQYKDFYKKYDNILDIPKENIIGGLLEYYNIDKNLTKYEIFPILNVYDQIKRQGYMAYKPINLAYGIKNETVAKIEEGLMEVPGIDISIEPVRYYPEGKVAAHILGYLGKISQTNEIEKYVDELGYSKNDIIGKTGIEESMEEVLRGTTGSKKVEVDPLGNTIKVVESGMKKAIPGNNVYLSIDLDLQKVAEKSLEKTLKELSRAGTFKSEWGDFQFGTNRGRPYKNANSGAVVVVDVKTGQVLASASYPAYDPNLFSTGISSTDWTSLFPENEKDQLAPRPLYNIVTQTAIQPGSIYKMATGLTALEKGLSPNKKIRDMGQIDIGPESFKCLAWTLSRSTHGNVDITEALRDSCNYYFYSLALGENQKTREQLGVKIDIDDIAETSTKLGLNDKTGIEINIPREVAVGVPTPEKKVKLMKALFRNFLNANIESYYKEDINKEELSKEQIVNTIVSWMDKDEVLSRNKVIEELENLGIDSLKVLAGKRASIADIIKYTYLNQVKWDITDTLNITIGQGQSAYTPIQMANYVAIIANGGYKHKLTLLDSIKNYNNSENIYIHESKPEKVDFNSPDNLEYLKKGMNLVAKQGTARRTFINFPEEVGVKTGTAEKNSINPATNEPYDNFAWFVGFAPYDEPEIAVATVLFQGGSGGYAAPLVREIMAEYLGLNKVKSTEELPYKNYLSQ